MSICCCLSVSDLCGLRLRPSATACYSPRAVEHCLDRSSSTLPRPPPPFTPPPPLHCHPQPTIEAANSAPHWCPHAPSTTKRLSAHAILSLCVCTALIPRAVALSSAFALLPLPLPSPAPLALPCLSSLSAAAAESSRAIQAQHRGRTATRQAAGPGSADKTTTAHQTGQRLAG